MAKGGEHQCITSNDVRFKLHGGNSGLDDVFYKCGVNRLEWLVVQVPHCEGQELPALQITKSVEPNQIKG
ncbi:hypothetical protein Bca4012_064250 [Brassica carinata]|uniref:Uncharacterized protein n=1 Tax=Brassica carinata TaxID=52824 RepID=A0A8X7SJG2_BRACI|nr:hypothetical protein Bca52824_033835 [Brassica carinata]